MQKLTANCCASPNGTPPRPLGAFFMKVYELQTCVNTRQNARPSPCLPQPLDGET